MNKVTFRTIIPFLFFLCCLVISNGLCMNVQPQVAKFEIIGFEDLNEITNTKTVNLTISCVDGSGSGSVQLTTDPSDVPLGFAPILEIPSMEVGDTSTLTIRVQNLGTPANQDFILNAVVKNDLNLFCDNALTRGTLLKRTRESTFITVVTKYNGTLMNGLPIKIKYFDYFQTGFTGSSNNGSVRFDFETSADVRTEVIFVGNDIYMPAVNTITVYGEHEETVTLDLNKINDSKEENRGNLEYTALIFGLIIAAIYVGTALVIVGSNLWKKHTYTSQSKMRLHNIHHNSKNSTASG